MGFSLKGAISGAIGGFSTGGPIGAVAGGALGGIAGGLDDASANAAYERQYRDNVNLWNMNNAYNSPVQQMQRLKDAGLNPMLVYGSGNVTGNASSSMSAPSYSQPEHSGLAKMMSMLNLKSTEADVTGKEYDNQMKELALEKQKLGIDLLRGRIAALQAGHGQGNATLNRLRELQIEKLTRDLNDPRGDLSKAYDDIKSLFNRVDGDFVSPVRSEVSTAIDTGGFLF